LEAATQEGADPIKEEGADPIKAKNNNDDNKNAKMIKMHH
jgi:hypothetical protein